MLRGDDRCRYVWSASATGTGRLSEVQQSTIPKDPGMGIVTFKYTVQNPPVYIRAHAVEQNLQLFADRDRGAITANQELCAHRLLRACPFVPQRRLEWVLCAGRLRRNSELCNRRFPLNQLLVTQQVPDVDSLYLALCDYM
jgi:hypothetical protein